MRLQAQATLSYTCLASKDTQAGVAWGHVPKPNLEFLEWNLQVLDTSLVTKYQYDWEKDPDPQENMSIISVLTLYGYWGDWGGHM